MAELTGQRIKEVYGKFGRNIIPENLNLDNGKLYIINPFENAKESDEKEHTFIILDKSTNKIIYLAHLLINFYKEKNERIQM